MTLQTQKFPYSDIMSLLGVDRKFNLAESTPEVLFFGDLLDEQLIEELKNLRLGYGTSRGLGPLRAMIAGNVGLLDENILITNGAAANLFLSIFCLCNPGDEVVVTSPNFPPILNIISAIGATKRALQLQFEEGYKLNLDRVEKLLNKNTRLVILVSPQNPSGVITEPDELKAIVSHIEKKASQAYLLVDETYRETTYGNQSARSSAANLSTKVLTTASLSKCHGAPGLRIGWLTCRNDALLCYSPKTGQAIKVEHVWEYSKKQGISFQTSHPRLSMCVLKTPSDRVPQFQFLSVSAVMIIRCIRGR